MKTIDIPPAAIQPDALLTKMSDMFQELKFGDPSPTVLGRLERYHDGLDPLYPLALAASPAEEDNREAIQIGSAFTMGAEICGAIAKAKRMSPDVQYKAWGLRGDLLLVRGDLLSSLPNQDPSELRADALIAEESYEEALAVGNRNPYSHANIANVMGVLSARAAAVHYEARSLTQGGRVARYDGLRHINRTAHNGIVHDTVGHLGKLGELLIDVRGDPANERGRLMEMFVFADEQLGRSAKPLEEGYTRFAVAREDRALQAERPRRGFDVVTLSSDQINPIQAKVGHGSKGYHKSITVTSLHRPEEFMADPSKPIDYFRTVIDRQADPVEHARARTLIRQMLKEEPAEQPLLMRTA